MDGTPRVSVVLPTYNERDNVEPLVTALASCLPEPWEILVVDDDSPDGTADVAESIRPRFSGLRVIRRRSDRGLVPSIRCGVEAARAPVVIWMDADLSMPPEAVPGLLAPVLEGRCDAAVGSRFADGGSTVNGKQDSGWVRLQRWLTRGLNRSLARSLRIPFHDWTSGFIAVRTEFVRAAGLQGAYGEYFIVLIARLTRAGAALVEVPYVCVPRQRGESKTASGPGRLLALGPGYLFAWWTARKIMLREGRAGRGPVHPDL